jgi:predicted DNA-binding protein (MmcQ/YjbR family)
MAGAKWTHAAHPIAKALRAAAMAYPDTTEDFPWDHPAYKAASKKAFLFMGGYADALTVSMKLPFRHEDACARDGATPTGYGLGKSGWVTFSFPKARAKADFAKLIDYLDESWRAVAPKKLSQAYAQPPAAAKPARKKKSATKTAAKKAKR